MVSEKIQYDISKSLV